MNALVEFYQENACNASISEHIISPGLRMRHFIPTSRLLFAKLVSKYTFCSIQLPEYRSNMNTSVSGDRTMRSDVHDVATWKKCNMIRASASS